MKVNDIVSGFILLILAALLWSAASDLPNPASQLYGPAFFPLWIAGAMGIAAAVMIVTSLGQAREVPFVQLQDWVRDPRRVAQFLLVPAAVVFYVYTVSALGFLATAAIVLFVLLIGLGVRLIVALPVTVGIVILVYAIFDMLLRVPLPRGTIFFS